MARKANWIKEIVLEIADRLASQIDVKEVIVFGSFAWGKPTKYSDLDIAIISPSFKDMSDIERIMFLTKNVRHLKTQRPMDIDIVGFTPREFDAAGHFDLAGEIKEKGFVAYRKAA